MGIVTMQCGDFTHQLARRRRMTIAYVAPHKKKTRTIFGAFGGMMEHLQGGLKKTVAVVQNTLQTFQTVRLSIQMYSPDKNGKCGNEILNKIASIEDNSTQKQLAETFQ